MPPGQRQPTIDELRVDVVDGGEVAKQQTVALLHVDKEVDLSVSAPAFTPESVFPDHSSHTRNAITDAVPQHHRTRRPACSPTRRRSCCSPHPSQESTSHCEQQRTASQRSRRLRHARAGPVARQVCYLLGVLRMERGEERVDGLDPPQRVLVRNQQLLDPAPYRIRTGVRNEPRQ